MRIEAERSEHDSARYGFQTTLEAQPDEYYEAGFRKEGLQVTFVIGSSAAVRGL